MRRLHVLEEVGSTNDLAKALARQGAPEGTLVVALRQTAGRGRPGRSWESPEGGFWASLVFRPPGGRPLPHLSLVLALAVARALQSLGLFARIKWPNDVVVEDRKIAGILIESASQADLIPFVVAGAGVNLNLDPAVLSGEVRARATSYLAETGRPVDVALFAARFVEQLAPRYEGLCGEGWPGLRVELLELDSLCGRRVTVDAGPWQGVRIEGLASCIDEEGRLVVESEGRAHRFSSGEVRLA